MDFLPTANKVSFRFLEGGSGGLRTVLDEFDGSEGGGELGALV
jgi:hypothetical protein